MADFKPDKHDIEELERVRDYFFRNNMPYESIERDDFIYDSGFAAGRGIKHIGEPIPEMVKILKMLLEAGYTVKIFTVRAQHPYAKPIIKQWLKDNKLPDLEITNVKDFNMYLLIDARCRQVKINTGEIVGGLEIEGIQL